MAEKARIKNKALELKQKLWAKIDKKPVVEDKKLSKIDKKVADRCQKLSTYNKVQRANFEKALEE